MDTRNPTHLAVQASRVVLPDGIKADGIVSIEGGTISAIHAAALPSEMSEIIHLEDATLLPGFIDLHVHGGGGCGRVAYETWPQILEQRTSAPGKFPFTSPHYGKNIQYSIGMCPRSEELVGRAVFIGVSPILSNEDVTEIGAGVRKVAEYMLSGAAVSS